MNSYEEYKIYLCISLGISWTRKLTRASRQREKGVAREKGVGCGIGQWVPLRRVLSDFRCSSFGSAGKGGGAQFPGQRAWTTFPCVSRVQRAGVAAGPIGTPWRCRNCLMSSARDPQPGGGPPPQIALCVKRLAVMRRYHLYFPFEQSFLLYLVNLHIILIYVLYFTIFILLM